MTRTHLPVDERGATLCESPPHFADLKINQLRAHAVSADAAIKKIALSAGEQLCLCRTGRGPALPFHEALDLCMQRGGG